MWKNVSNSFSNFIIPMHVDGNHWVLSHIDIGEKTITYYDSVKISLSKVKSLCESLADVFEFYMTQKLRVCNYKDWEYIIADTPRQRNNYDCGVFMCRFMLYLYRNRTIDFEQSDMEYLRVLMSVELLKGRLID
jgi:sentrin-specific protease 1